MADDFGRFHADPVVVRGVCLPFVRTSEREIRHWLNELGTQDLASYYLDGDRILGFFRTWEKYQQRRAKQSKYPLPADASICTQLPANVLETRDTRNETRDTRSEAAHAGCDVSASAGENGNGEAPVTPEEIAEAWNEICGPLGLTSVREVRGSRRERVLRRLREHPEIDFWRDVIQAIPRQPFLLGKGKGGWKVSFDFLFENDVNATKIAEGRYA